MKVELGKKTGRGQKTASIAGMPSSFWGNRLALSEPARKGAPWENDRANLPKKELMAWGNALQYDDGEISRRAMYLLEEHINELSPHDARRLLDCALGSGDFYNQSKAVESVKIHFGHDDRLKTSIMEKCGSIETINEIEGLSRTMRKNRNFTRFIYAALATHDCGLQMKAVKLIPSALKKDQPGLIIYVIEKSSTQAKLAALDLVESQPAGRRLAIIEAGMERSGHSDAEAKAASLLWLVPYQEAEKLLRKALKDGAWSVFEGGYDALENYEKTGVAIKLPKPSVASARAAFHDFLSERCLRMLYLMRFYPPEFQAMVSKKADNAIAGWLDDAWNFPGDGSAAIRLIPKQEPEKREALCGKAQALIEHWMGRRFVSSLTIGSIRHLPEAMQGALYALAEQRITEAIRNASADRTDISLAAEAVLTMPMEYRLRIAKEALGSENDAMRVELEKKKPELLIKAGSLGEIA